MEELLRQIISRLDRIEGEVRRLNNPLASVRVEEKVEAVKKAMATGDKRLIRQTIKQMNGGR